MKLKPFKGRVHARYIVQGGLPPISPQLRLSFSFSRCDFSGAPGPMISPDVIHPESPPSPRSRRIQSLLLLAFGFSAPVKKRSFPTPNDFTVFFFLGSFTVPCLHLNIPLLPKLFSCSFQFWIWTAVSLAFFTRACRSLDVRSPLI